MSLAPLLALWLLAASATSAEEAPAPEPVSSGSPFIESSDGPSRASVQWDAVELFGAEVAPGDKRQLFLGSSESFSGTSVDLPVLVIRGLTPGPTVCLMAGIHGDELNGIEIVRTLFEHTTPRELSGMLLGVPVANLHGLRRSSRYLPDRRDLNRFFPGHPAGSSAARIASALFRGVVRRCDALVDFHTGSFHRTNLPQLRANLRVPAILTLARAFGGGVVVHSPGPPGTLRRAATDAGIPTVTYEAGEPMRFQKEEIRRGVDGVSNLLSAFGMVDRRPRDVGLQRLYYRTRWVRADDGGIFLTDRRLGEKVREGALLGTVTDPVSNERTRIRAPFGGTIIGMALPQVVIPGFAAFHLGVDGPPLETGEERPEAVAPAPLPPDQLDLEEHPE